jgi:hypothetical protein
VCKHREATGRVQTIDGHKRAPTPTIRNVRASDRDREAVVALLNEHTGAGRLSVSEFEERVSSAYAARTLAELDVLLTDLPAAQTVPVRLWHRGHTSAWLATAVICLAIWSLTSLGTGTWLYFWPVWVIGPWGMVILGRLLVERGLRAQRQMTS